jgi:hypothetical protein
MATLPANGRTTIQSPDFPPASVLVIFNRCHAVVSVTLVGLTRLPAYALSPMAPPDATLAHTWNVYWLRGTLDRLPAAE